MKFSSTGSKAIAAISLVTVTSIVLSGEAVFAQTVDPNTNVNQNTNVNVVVVDTTPQKGFGGAYVGAGVAAGVTNGGQTNTSALIGGNIQGRVQIPNTPVSARASVAFGGDNAAIIPMVTYDVPVAKNTNVYVGGGYSFVEDKTSFGGVKKPSPMGNKNAPVVVLGAESSLSRDVVVYGDAKWGINAYQNTNADSISLQAGVGYRF